MSNKSIYFIGISGVCLFAFSAIIGGVLAVDYSVVSQFISESYAIDTEHGLILRIFGYIPSGILLVIFNLFMVKNFKSSRITRIGFYGLAIFYGVSTIIVGVFPCDSGCNREMIDPSLAQLIHNWAGSLTYVFVPISILTIGFGLKRLADYSRLSHIAFAAGLVSVLFIYLLGADPSSVYIGLYQRIVESVFIIFIISSAVSIKGK